jgi:hypothetical protein
VRDMNAGRGIHDIFADIKDAFTTLVRKEVQLAKAELSDKASGIGTGVAVMAAGGVLCLGGFIILLESIVSMLIQAGLSPATAGLIVAVVVLAIGGGIIYSGLRRLQGSGFMPERTINQLNRDAEVAKEQLHLSPKHSESVS